MTQDVDAWIDEYVKIRDLIKKREDEHKEALKPLRNRQEELTGLLQKVLDDTNTDKVSAKSGTAYTTTKYNAALADPEAFMAFVASHGYFDLLDRKANVTAVKEYVLENKALPPGVNLTQFKTVNVRRS